MAKSSRASTKKANNQRLKKNVFGPVESERAQRLSAKLLELASQPKPVKEAEMVDAVEDDADQTNSAAKAQKDNEDEEAMEIDSGSRGKAAASKPGRKRIEKRRVKKSSIVFPKYKDRRGQKKSK